MQIPSNIKLKGFIKTSEKEKITANETTDKGLISKIYKQLIQLNTRKTNNPTKKWKKDLSKHFSKDVIILLMASLMLGTL